MKCILHIGTEKTGTTLLQKSLYENRQVLLEEKIYLTEQFGIPNNWHVPFYFCKKYDGHFMKKNNIHSHTDKEVFFSDFSKNFEEELQKAKGCKYFFLTSEHFHSRLKETDDILDLKAFLGQYFEDFTIICYFREQSSMALSLHSTDLKGGGFASLDKFMHRARPENYYFNFLQIADNWSQAFGRENSIFRIYDQRYFFNGDLKHDFCHSLGISRKLLGDEGLRTRENLSLSAFQSVVLREVNEAFLSPQRTLKSETRRAVLKDKILEIDALKQGPIHYSSQRDIYENFRSSNKEFLEKYFPNGEFFKFDDKSPISEKSFSETEVSDLLTKVTNTLVNEVIDLSDDEYTTRESSSIFSKWWSFLDYRLHRWISQNSWLPKQVRHRFIGPTNRRRKRLARKYPDFVA